MSNNKTNFDDYLDRKRADPIFNQRFEAADEAWDIALQLSALRQARGLTQKQVAELLGTRQQAISRLEDPAYAGHSLSMVRRYLAVLGARLDLNIVVMEPAGNYQASRKLEPLPAAHD